MPRELAAKTTTKAVIEPANWHRLGGQALAPAAPGPAVIFDLDGVISDASHRQHFLRRRRQDWRGFFMAAVGDAPLRTGLGLFEGAARGRPRWATIICTARPHYLADITKGWLAAHGVRPHLLILRSPYDRSSAAAFKRRELSRLRRFGYRIEAAIDDDERVIAMYRSEGVAALYCHSGYYDRRT